MMLVETYYRHAQFSSMPMQQGDLPRCGPKQNILQQRAGETPCTGDARAIKAG